MISLESDRGQNFYRLKGSKSVGNLIIDNKKKLEKLKSKQNKTFIKALTKLNNSLKKSEYLTNIPYAIKKNNSVMKSFKLKEMYINNKREKYGLLPDINKNRKNINETNNTNNSPKKLMLFNSPNNANLKNNNYQINTKSAEESKMPFYLKALSFPKKTRTSAQIIKMSKAAINSGNPFKKYCFNLEENVGEYVESKDKFSGYNRFNEVLKQYIKEDMTGLGIPGNVLNRDTIGYKRTIQPQNIKNKIKKSIVPPNKTLVPIPRELAGKGISYTHISFKEVYNEKNKLL